MGLSISYDAWDGGYGAFNRWRHEIAKLEDIPLSLMQGFYGGSIDYANIMKDTLTDSGFNSYLGDMFQREYIDQLPLAWESLKKNPIHRLLYHSDCDGNIKYKHLNGIIARLEYLVDNKSDAMSESCIQRTRQFIIGARKAHANNDKLRFY
jgi:hypothetical protein